MPFKEAVRVIYQKNPLVEVVCQLRFPRILSINETLPAEFQERIREIYPLFEMTTEQQQQVTIDAVADDAEPIPRLVQVEKTKNYKFSSADGVWRVNLTSTFFALSTSSYTTWDDFLSRLYDPFNALIELYKPAFFERIGLRYIDAFRRQHLGLADTPWNELIEPFALGFLSNRDIMDEVKGFSSIGEIDIGNGALARINTTLGYVGSIDTQMNTGNPELSFIVDSDMFYGKKTIEQAFPSLDSLHGTSTKLIRALITDKLHEAMEPKLK